MHRITILAVLLLGHTISWAAQPHGIVPERLNPDTLSVTSLPWVQTGDSYRSSGNSIALDDEGNIYIAGHFESYINCGTGDILASGEETNMADIFLAKYDPLGNLQWIQTAGGLSDDKGLGVAASGDNVYLTGYFSGICYFGDTPLLTKDLQNLFLAKYNTQGELQWLKRAESDGILRPQAITADSKGNAYVTGNFRKHVAFGNLSVSREMNQNVFLVKYDPQGNPKWLRQASGGNTLITYVYVYDLVCDHNDDLVMSGEMMGPVKFGSVSYKTRQEWHNEGPLPKREIFMAKYDENGNLSWFTNTGVECNFTDITVDKDNNLVMSGYFLGALEGNLKGKAQFGKTTIQTHLDMFEDCTPDAFVAKFNPKGELSWVEAFGGIAEDRASGVTTDPEGNIYATGFFMSQVDYGNYELKSKKYRVDARDIFLIKYSPAGDIEWIETAGSSQDDEGSCLVADDKGNIYVTGTFEGNAAFGKNWVTTKRYKNMFLAKYLAKQL